MTQLATSPINANMRLLGVYFVITYAVTWAFWFAAAAMVRASGLTGTPAPGLWTIFIYLGTFTPAFVAIGMTMIAEGTQGFRALLVRLIQWRVPARLYVFAIAFMAVVKLAVAGLHRAAFGQWPTFGQTPVLLMLGATLMSVLILGQAGEEVGWRGFALPRLASRLGLGWASVLLGVIWAAWHLPIFFIFPFADKYGQSFPLYLAQVVPLSVAIAWLWWRANGSLLLTMLLHAAVNNTKDIVPSASTDATNVWGLSASRPAWLTVAVLWLCAAAFLVSMRGQRVRIPQGESL